MHANPLKRIELKSAPKQRRLPAKSRTHIKAEKNSESNIIKCEETLNERKKNVGCLFVLGF